MTRVTASAPGKVIVTGEYAVLDGAPAVCMAVNRRARVTISAATEPGVVVSAPGFLPAPIAFSSVKDSFADLPLLAAVWQKLPEAPTKNLKIELDSQAFQTAAGEKIGAGSSAAVAVALTAAIERFAGTQSDVFGTALDAHHAFQGGSGSGADIACSFAGGVIEYRKLGSEIAGLSWPRDLNYTLLWSGQSADTAAQIEKLGATKSRSSRANLSNAASEIAEAWKGGDTATIISGLKNYSDALRLFDADHQLGIFGAGHAELADAAASGDVVYKPCGAGAGDLGIAVASSEPALQEFVSVARNRHYQPVDLKIDATGVELEGAKE